MDERARRIGLNEALFREVNGRLESLNEAFASLSERMEIVCECGDLQCTEMLTLTLDDYRSLRADPALFAVKRGHDAADVEEVVEQHERYDVIRKTPGAPTRLAEATEPGR